MFNDNTLLEYILQDEIFMGVIGIFECGYSEQVNIDRADPQTTQTSRA
jgi:hypothetical protein